MFLFVVYQTPFKCAQCSVVVDTSLTSLSVGREYWRQKNMTVSAMKMTLNWIFRRERTETEAK